MALAPELIYCADGNARMAQIAIDAGFLYGAQMPNKIYFDPYFVDQNWKSPDLGKYLMAIRQHRPCLASVLDWETCEQLPEVLAWAEAIAPFVKEIIIIPKVIGGIGRLPRIVGGKSIRLGYSVPTSFGGTPVPAWEFAGWPVHLLGGSPVAQYKISHYLDVISLDGNYHLKMATYYNQFFCPSGTASARNRFWPTLPEADGEKWGDGSSQADAPYEAFRRSCMAIMEMWRKY